jgi:hypothetical protein
MALQIGAISNNQEDYGCTFFMVYLKHQASENLLTEIDAEIVKPRQN